METLTLLRELEKRGATVSLEGEALRVQPSRVLSDELRIELRSLKPEIVALLKQREARDSAPSALETLAREAEAARVGAHVHPTKRVLAAWRAAENEVGHTLTLRGERRGDPLPSTRAGELHREAIAEVNAGPYAKWSGAKRREFALALVESEVAS